MLARFCLDGRRAQSGTTLVELLVSLTIASMALALIVGTLSTGLIDATLAKRNTAAQAVLQYEMEQVNASAFTASYSDCFATENPTSPVPAAGYGLACPSGPYTLRADVTLKSSSGTLTRWLIAITSWPSGSPMGSSVEFYKANHS